ncbi:GntR family transcriptional regulator [Streptomyces sp. NRRL S-340]|uniref:GntR family transcriptional regulator n=1 Tax=Streptomyces sp. NRRL S-340 TaxID=1463901 RepID=UPI001F404037|nr:GntR family transcriptional regulator [Streptomyces sp. NRRL S-340]
MIRPVSSRRDAIAGDLRSQIITGRLKAGERLPSEPNLAARYAVSLPTLRSALAALQGEGLIEKVHGRGNFVRRPLRRLTYVGGGRHLDAATSADAALRVTVRTAKIRARGQLAALMNVPARSPLTEFICLAHEGEAPHSLAHIYVPRDLAPAAVPEESTLRFGALVSVDDLPSPLAEVQERVRVRLPTQEEASVLRLGSAWAVLAIRRVMTDAAGRVVEVAFLVFPGDHADAVFTTHHQIDGRRPEEWHHRTS